MSIEDARPASPGTSGSEPGQGWFGRNKKKLLRTLPVVLVAVGFGVFRLVGIATGIGQAEVGSCAQEVTSGNDTEYEQVDCGDPAATLTVLAQLPHGGDCRTVAGATQSSSDGKDAKATCFGPKGADPARSLNTIAAGECVNEKGEDRVACTGPEAFAKVVERFDGVAKEKVETICDPVAESDASLDNAWSESTTLYGFGTGTTEGDHTVLCVAFLHPQSATAGA